MSVDFFVVPTVMFRVLFVFVVLVHQRRRLLHFNITEHPTAQWTAQHLVETFTWGTPPRYLLRDRDGVYGTALRARVKRLGIEEVLTAPRSPWQNPYVERVIGSIRRECVDQVVVLGERHLGGSSSLTSGSTIAGVVTGRWRWTARILDLRNRPSAGEVWKSRKLAAFTDTTSGARPGAAALVVATCLIIGRGHALAADIAPAALAATAHRQPQVLRAVFRRR